MRTIQNAYLGAKRLSMMCLLFLGCVITSGYALAPNGGYAAPYFQADYIQDLSDFTSAMVNPALLYRVDQFYFGGGVYRWDLDLDDNLGYQQVSFLAPIRLNQTVGATIIGTGSPIQEVKLSQAGAITPGGISRYGDIWIVGHYGVRLFPWFMVGANPKLLRQNQFNSDKKLGFGMDVGMYFNPIDHYRFGDLGISLTMQDIIPAMLDWKSKSDTNGVAQAASSVTQQVTTRFRAGLRYAWLNDRLIWNGELVVDNMFVDLWKSAIDDIEFNDIKDGTILQKVPRFSSHFKVEFIPQVWVKFGWANNNIPYVGFNLNLILPLPEMINYVNFDTHLGYSINETERGLTLMMKLGTDFGPTREQRESKRLYDRLILAPMNAYHEAMRLYLAGKYWEASFAFGKVLSLFPNFHLNDKATFYMGNCYRFLHMNDIAREIYKEGLAEYTTSDVRPKMLYGIQNLDYREGKYEDALKNHAFITNLYSDSEIRPDADYLAGEIHFQRKNYNAAEQYLGRIEPDAPTYLYAQYTLSIINYENGKVNAAITNLNNIVKDTTSDPSELLLVDAANNKLGQLYFEEVELRKAVEAFDQVPEGSPYGDDALLGIAWSWIKVNRPEEAQKTVQRLIGAHSESALIPEAYLVLGYSLMLQGRNEEAIDALEISLQMAKGDFADEEDLEVRTQRFNGYVREFSPIAQDIKKNALRRPSETTIAERTSLKTEFDKYSQESRQYFDFKLLVEDNQHFFRRKEQIISDAEYALAKAVKMIGGRREQAIIEKEIEKQEKLDEEIERLKRELESTE